MIARFFVILLAVSAIFACSSNVQTSAQSTTLDAGCSHSSVLRNSCSAGAAAATPTPTPTPGVQASPTPIASSCATCIFVNEATGSDSNNGQTSATAVQSLQRGANLVTSSRPIVVLQTGGGSGHWTASASGTFMLITHTGSSGTPFYVQCDHVTTPPSCNIDGNSATGGFGINFNDSMQYYNIIGVRVDNFQFVCVNENGGSDGSGKGDSNINFLWGEIDHCGSDGARVADFSTNDWFGYTYIHNEGNIATSPNYNQDHGLYLSCDNCGAYSDVFAFNIYGWDIQYTPETTTQRHWYSYNNTYGNHQNGFGTPTNIGNIVMPSNGFNTPNFTSRNDLFGPSNSGQPVACFGKPIIGSATVDIQYALVATSSPVTDCTAGSSGTLITGHNILNQPANFVNASPAVATDFELGSTAAAISAGVTGIEVYDFLGYQYNNTPSIGAFEFPI